MRPPLGAAQPGGGPTAPSPLRMAEAEPQGRGGPGAVHWSGRAGLGEMQRQPAPESLLQRAWEGPSACISNNSSGDGDAPKPGLHLENRRLVGAGGHLRQKVVQNPRAARLSTFCFSHFGERCGYSRSLPLRQTVKCQLTVSLRDRRHQGGVGPGKRSA